MSKYETIKLFPLQINAGQLNLPQETRQLFVNEIETQATKYTYDDTWTGDVNGKADLHNNVIFKPLFDLIPSLLRDYCEELGLKSEKFNFYIARSWGTRSLPDQRINTHEHTYAALAFIYYPYVPTNGSGLIIEDRNLFNELIPDLFTKGLTNYKKLLHQNVTGACNSVTIPVQTDDYIIMPAKTTHGTSTSPKAKKPRYSIAVDIVMTLKEIENIEHCLPPVTKWNLI